ncbi:hypothetical protein [Methylobacterium gossipiicola]|uniref:Uncharacterized protein n=1 Tax=Methylobacterium gossipiicola TaxID=582675 RepID=A0A1I2SZR5_9HYPH|nr:hypothetical protein [Methylobacterium gossipiicola]SFG58118.1 hypothetical protein SAMN05192565_10620 [Methylobacterium gossipiicola]
MARASRRLERRSDFEFFVREAPATFRRLADADPRNAFFDPVYRLCITPGGAMGGIDRRMLEVFYGSRPFEAVREFVPRQDRFPSVQERLLAENGARLVYQRVDNGTVMCTLEPARSEGFRRPEDAILLEWVRRSHVLTGESLPARHWRAFVSYMECTSLEGEPSLGDRVRVWWLLATRRLVVAGVERTPLYRRVLLEVAKFSATVGLSGFLLKVVEVWFATPKP